MYDWLGLAIVRVPIRGKKRTDSVVTLSVSRWCEKGWRNRFSAICRTLTTLAAVVCVLDRRHDPPRGPFADGRFGYNFGREQWPFFLLCTSYMPFFAVGGKFYKMRTIWPKNVSQASRSAASNNYHCISHQAKTKNQESTSWRYWILWRKGVFQAQKLVSWFVQEREWDGGSQLHSLWKWRMCWRWMFVLSSLLLLHVKTLSLKLVENVPHSL